MRNEQDDARHGEQNAEKSHGNARQQLRQGPEFAQIMGPLGHVGNQAAVQVAIPQPRNFFQKSHPQTGFESSSESQCGCGDGQLEHQHAHQEKQQGRQGEPAFVKFVQLQSDIQNAAEQHGFGGNAKSGHDQSEEKHQRRKQFVRTQEPEQFFFRSARRLFQSRGQFRRQRLRRIVRVGGLFDRFFKLRIGFRART